MILFTCTNCRAVNVVERALTVVCEWCRVAYVRPEPVLTPAEARVVEQK